MTSPASEPPEKWSFAGALMPRILRPIERFLRIEAASGIVLLAAAALAMVWANSPLRESYARLWQTPLGIQMGALRFQRPLHFWVNEGVMTLFFFLVGLELRRELHNGELSSKRRAALPAIAAVGGMLVPALLFLALNRGLPSARGWGVPIATDIAFAVGILTIVGKRVPTAARVFLLALAVIDDIGAILVIALFYATSFSFAALLLSLLGVAVIVGLRGFGVRRPLAYVAPSVLIWMGLFRAGIHPTLAGVVLGMLTPVRPWFGRNTLAQTARSVADAFDATEPSRDLVPHLQRLSKARRDALAPATLLEAAVHPWVAFGVMPLFALANAGVEMSGISLAAPESRAAAAGVVGGLVLGKPLGIFGFSYVAARLGLASRPKGVTWGALLSVGAIAGVGFTMSIFIADLAFDGAELLRVTKLAILTASTLAAGAGGLLAARTMRPRTDEAEAAASTPAVAD